MEDTGRVGGHLGPNPNPDHNPNVGYFDGS